MHIPLMYMNILIYGYGHLTSSIWSGSASEQICASSGRLSITITRVGFSGADPTKNLLSCRRTKISQPPWMTQT